MYNPPRQIIRHGFFSDFYYTRPSMGIILQSPGNNQLALEVLHEINRVQPMKTEISLYVEEWDKPYIHPPCPLYHTMDLVVHRGNLVSTCIEGVIDMVRIGLAKQMMWYIYTPHDFTLYDPKDLQDLMSHKDIIKVCRMPDQRDMFHNMYDGAEIEEETMQSFNIELALKIFKQHSKRKLPI